MALKKFHLIKDRFLFDDYESGLYFDICPLTRKGNEDEFGSLINEAGEEVAKLETKPGTQQFRPTLLLTEEQMYAIPESYRDSFGAKSFLLLYKKEFDGNALPPDIPWFAIQAGGLICCTYNLKDKSKWVYYTNWTANNLDFRYRKVKKSEVDAYEEPGGTSPPPTPPPTEDPNDPPDPVVSGGLTIHMNCPHCGKVIF